LSWLHCTMRDASHYAS